MRVETFTCRSMYIVAVLCVFHGLINLFRPNTAFDNTCLLTLDSLDDMWFVVKATDGQAYSAIALWSWMNTQIARNRPLQVIPTRTISEVYPTCPKMCNCATKLGSGIKRLAKIIHKKMSESGSRTYNAFDKDQTNHACCCSDRTCMRPTASAFREVRRWRQIDSLTAPLPLRIRQARTSKRVQSHRHPTLLKQ